MILLESGEMYLETILVLQQRNTNVRSIDISEEMNFSKPSVSRAMGILREGGFITIDGGGFITLTETGLEVATTMYERHCFFTDWLVSIGVTPATAAEDACRIEHYLSAESFSKIKEYIEQHK